MTPAAPEPADTAEDGGTGSSLRILVVDADDRTRESVVGILGIRHRFDVVGSAAYVADAIALAKQTRPEIVIMDPRLPDVTDGMSLVRRIRAIDPSIAILVVGWSPDLEHQALAAGADGFVRKTFKPGDLAAAVGRCMDSRVAGVAGAIADASERIASVKGEVGLVGGPGAASHEPAAASTRPVRVPGAGVVL